MMASRGGFRDFKMSHRNILSIKKIQYLMAQSKGKKRQIIICYRDIGCFYRTQTKAALQKTHYLLP